MSASVPAPWGRRAAAFAIDIVGFFFVQLTLALVIDFLNVTRGMSQNQVENWYRFMDVVTVWLYFTTGEASDWMATPGKKVMGLKTQAALGGGKLSILSATLRAFSRALSLVLAPVAVFLAWRDPQRRLLHDRIAGSVVVTAPAAPAETTGKKKGKR